MNGILALVLLVLDIIAVVEIVRSGLAVEKKILWVILVLILPLVGLILWYLLGRRG